jgi:hypothetical protein
MQCFRGRVEGNAEEVDYTSCHAAEYKGNHAAHPPTETIHEHDHSLPPHHARRFAARLLRPSARIRTTRNTF